MTNNWRSKQEISIRDQPSPIDPHWIRYTTHPLPAYTHIPSVTPHPLNDPRGHSYGIKPDNVQLITENSWRTNQIYLYGFDLYNYCYWWEAHETWEGIWQLSEKKAPLGRFIQGLILLSTTFLKRHQGRLKGVQSLSSKALKHLKFVVQQATTDVYMGVDLPSLIEKFQACTVEFLQDPLMIDPFRNLKPQPLIRLQFNQ